MKARSRQTGGFITGLLAIVSIQTGYADEAPVRPSVRIPFGSIKPIAGILPVSGGGDSISRTVEIQAPAAPAFAQPGGVRTEGAATAGIRSVNDSFSAALNGAVAGENFSASYAGAYTQGKSRKDGHGATVLASQFEKQEQAVTFAARGRGNLVSLRVGEQFAPHQGNPNQYLDVTGDHAVSADLYYAGDHAWGWLDARLSWRDSQRQQGFFSTEKTGDMLTHTHGRNFDYAIMATVPLQGRNQVRLGHEYHQLRLDEEWPALNTATNGPDAYKNINGGSRERVAFFAEWEGQMAARWHGLLGIRDEIVRTDTGAAQPYGSAALAADNAAAAAFNSRSHNRRDNNLDLAALLRFDATPTSAYEIGFAQKTRSPTLYERYAWGRSTQAMTLTNNLFGDGNGYVGDIDLKPQSAETFSAALDWHDSERKSWFVRLSPYYAYLRNYIGVNALGSFNPYPGVTRNRMQFANHNSKRGGINLSWQLPLADSADWGILRFRGEASLTQGSRIGGASLYQMMPLNTLFAVEQNVGRWQNTLETRMVARKNHVNTNRLEPRTGGYALLDLRTRYRLDDKITFTAGISNLFNRYYSDPVGGVYLAGVMANGGGTLIAMPGYGRSGEMGVSVVF